MSSWTPPEYDRRSTARRRLPEIKTCPDCGLRYANSGHHMEVCTGPKNKPPCGRRVLNPGGYGHHSCSLPSGHWGRCL